MAFWKDQKFIALKNKWYQKLKDSGFKEIETTTASKDFLINWESTRFYKDYTPDEVQEHLAYFRMCDDFYWHYASWKDSLERKIWYLHSQGHSRRKIAVTLQQQKIKISDSYVQIILARLKLIMKTQTWLRVKEPKIHSEGKRSDCRRRKTKTYPASSLSTL